MAQFSLLIRSDPYSGTGHNSALDFARALIRNQHSLKRVFFYQNAVLVGSYQQAPQGELAIHQEWASLAEQSGTELHVCIANALRRGITDHKEAQRYALPATTLHPAFQLSGLGEMASALTDSDRVVEF